MFCVAGLDRGFAANVAAVKDTEAAIYSLVGAAGGSPALSYQTPEGLPSLRTMCFQKAIMCFVCIQA